MPSFHGDFSISTWIDRQVIFCQRLGDFICPEVNVNTETRDARTIFLFLSSVSRAAIYTDIRTRSTSFPEDQP